MKRTDVLQGMLATGVVAIVRLGSSERLVPVVEAIAEGGVRHIEFPMTTPDALDTLARVSQYFAGDLVIGAGTVLDPESARVAILTGARFIVAPNLNPDLVHLCHRYDVVCMPGALTPGEVVRAWELGADVVKLFPAGAMGPAYVRALLAPLPQVRLAPVGGVDLDNVADYIQAGAACVGVGSGLASEALVESEDWEELTRRARGLVEGVQRGRG